MSELYFKPVSVQLLAPVWTLIPCAGRPLMIIEQRDEQKRLASFSAFNFEKGRFLWRDVVLPEKWWVNLVSATKDYIVLKVFESIENPDQTTFLFLNADDGRLMEHQQEIDGLHTNDTMHPFQYLDGEPDFATVKDFLRAKFDVTPRLSAEYLEYSSFIFISYYIGNPAAFVNRLAIFNLQGECLYEEEIGTKLKGIGVNTFFISSGYLFFVKNKTELVTFRIV